VVKREAEELLLIEEADAWFEYLEATRSQSQGRYGEIEHKPSGYWLEQSRALAGSARHGAMREEALGGAISPALPVFPGSLANHPRWDMR